MSVPTPATQDRQCAPSSVRPVVIACYHYSIANPNGMSVQRNECSLSSVLRQSDPSKVRYFQPSDQFILLKHPKLRMSTSYSSQISKPVFNALQVRANWTLYSQSHRGRPPGGSAWLGMFWGLDTWKSVHWVCRLDVLNWILDWWSSGQQVRSLDPTCLRCGTPFMLVLV